MERRSVYAQLLHETNQYQKTVAELEQLLPEAGENPEAAWRAKILMRTAQAVDQELWTKLYDYEKSLRSREEDPEVRRQQSACVKLHRDFKRSHKALVLALTMFEKTQNAEISRLGAVGWSERQDEQEDFYTKSMRERQEELEDMTGQMEKVKDLYHDLGKLIQQQQELIDKLEDTNAEAHTYTKNATKSMWEEFLCFADVDSVCQTERSITVNNGKWKVDGEELVFALPSCEKVALSNIRDGGKGALARKASPSHSSIASDYSEESPRGVMDSSVSAFSEADYQHDTPRTSNHLLRVSEDFHWLMPLETIAADIKAVHSDIMHFGKEVTSEVIAQTHGFIEKSDS